MRRAFSRATAAAIDASKILASAPASDPSIASSASGPW